jgi:NAD(P)H-dependent flavin oxidoreductase YrpB (nitropropane dioxygenase family)
MFAARNFIGVVTGAIKEKIDLIITGAGISRDIFKIGRDSNTPIIPVVSSARLAKTFQGLGASALVVEGKEAGGHLGTNRSVKEILPEVRSAADIPVIAAGGIINGRDIAKMFLLGADGVQMATRFVISDECAASQEFKEAYLNAHNSDILRITSPTGFPGQAIRTKFSEKIVAGNPPRPTYCDFCLKSCTYEYCIFEALTNAQHGNIEDGVVFAGEKVTELRNKKIMPVAEIMKELISEAEEINEAELVKEIKEEQDYFKTLPHEKDHSTRSRVRSFKS